MNEAKKREHKSASEDQEKKGERVREGRERECCHCRVDAHHKAGRPAGMAGPRGTVR